MCEIPSNVLLAEEFAEVFDGFSIGSNDLMQLILGVDRDSEIVAPIFDERNAAVKKMIAQVIGVARAKGRKIGICGQAPSDYPKFAQFLVEQGIDSISGSKAEHAIEALSRLVLTESTVRRGGRRRRIPSEQLVPGGVVLLQSGDHVAADLRLASARSLQVDESALTGESVPVHKHSDPLALETVLADRRNLAFAGTLVTFGLGEGVVWATGDETETGRIAWLISEAVSLETPLTRKIVGFSRLLLWLEVHCLRDLTRGGLASALNEIAHTAGVQIDIDESAASVREDVQGACEILGLDPLYIAYEGRLVAFIAPRDASRALDLMRTHSLGACAQIIGNVKRGSPGLVTMTSLIGARRVLDMLSGEQLPRIC
jgi:hypothetical protein